MVVPERFFDLVKFSHRAIFFLHSPVWESLNNLDHYLNSLDLGKIESPIPSNATLIHPKKISIGKNTIIEPGAYIEGPCVIGCHCQIRHGAYLRKNVLIGDECTIGHATELKHTIFLNGSSAPHFNYVGNSILGNHVNIGAGLVCANVRLDRREVIVDIKGKLYKTGLNKFGAVIGDHSHLGCHCVINPGVLLRKKTYLKGGISVQKSNLQNH